MLHTDVFFDTLSCLIGLVNKEASAGGQHMDTKIGRNFLDTTNPWARRSLVKVLTLYSVLAICFVNILYNGFKPLMG